MSNCLFIGKYNYGKCYFIVLRCMHDLIENHKICDDDPKDGQNKRAVDTEQFSSSKHDWWAREACQKCLYISFFLRVHVPNGPTAIIFYGLWIKQSSAMTFIFNLDKLLLKKLFPTMNI